MSSFGRGHVKGVLGSHGEGFRAHLLASGYTWGSAVHQVHLMAHFSRWLEDGELTAAQVNRAAIGAFIAARRSEGYVHLLSERAMAPMINYLRKVGLVPEEAPRPGTPVEALLAEFERYLRRERRLAKESVRSYVGVARQFLVHTGCAGQPDLQALDAAAVTGFVRDECARRGVGSASATVTGTRAWLRFLHADGEDAALTRTSGAIGRGLVARPPAPWHRRERVGASSSPL